MVKLITSKKDFKNPIPIAHKWIAIWSVLIIALAWIPQSILTKILLTALGIIILLSNASGRK